MKNNIRNINIRILITLALLSAALIACSAVVPQDALAEGQAATATATPEVHTSQPTGAATFQYLCDGGKIDTVIMGKVQASIGIGNEFRIPFNCALLANYVVADGFKLEVRSEPLPGQRPDLPIVADTIVKITRK